MNTRIEHFSTSMQGGRGNYTQRFFGSFATYFRARKDLDRLAEMSDQSLEDIGITRSEISEHKSKLFLRVFR